MNKWISVDNDLPKEFYKAKLVWVESESGSGTYMIASLDGDEDYSEWVEWTSDKNVEDLGYEVIAWRELPDEYRGE